MAHVMQSSRADSTVFNDADKSCVVVSQNKHSFSTAHSNQFSTCQPTNSSFFDPSLPSETASQSIT